MKLIDRLEKLEKKKGAESKFKFKIDVIKDHVEETLNALVPRLHQAFTLHDYEHVKAVISNLDRFCDKMDLFSDKNDRRLSKYEIFLLLAGAYLHDIGMIFVEEKDKLIFVGDEKDAARLSMSELSNKIRKDHPERSMKYVEQNKAALHITETDSQYISTICFGHGDWELEDKRYKNQPDHTNEEGGDAVIRIRFLTALLQVADELDASCERAPAYIRKVLQDWSMDCISQFHWMKHYYTGTPDFAKYIGIDKKVIINLTLKVPDELHGIRIKAVFEGRIRLEIDFVKPILRRYCDWYFDLNPIDYIINTGLESTPEAVFRAYFISDGPLKILLIEDEGFWQDSYKKKLENGGGKYSISIAKNRKSADENIKKNYYHMIVLDLKIPDNDGPCSTEVGDSVMDLIKQSCPNSIVLVLSASMNYEDNQRIRDGHIFIYKTDFYTNRQRSPQKIIETIIKDNLHLLKKEPNREQVER